MNCFCLATGQTFHSCCARGPGPSQSANYHPIRHPSRPLASYHPSHSTSSTHSTPSSHSTSSTHSTSYSRSANYHPRRHPSHPLASYRPKRPWLSNHPLPPHHLARSPARAPGRRAEICGTCREAPQRNAGCHSAVEGGGVSCRLGWVGPTPTPTPTLWCVAAAAGGRGCSRSPQAGWRGSQGEGGGGVADGHLAVVPAGRRAVLLAALAVLLVRVLVVLVVLVALTCVLKRQLVLDGVYTKSITCM